MVKTKILLNTKTKKTEIEILLKTILTVLFAFFLATFIKVVAFEFYHIPSSSMENTLLKGDYIIVSKYDYGYGNASLPFKLNLFKKNQRIIFNNKPERGDIIVFKKNVTGKNINYIKRVIGLPGESIQIINGIIYINGKLAVKQKSLNTHKIESNNFKKKVVTFSEVMNSGKTYNILQAVPQNSLVDNTNVFHIPKNSYFVMGDNRNNSIDSRFLLQMGYVTDDQVVGKAKTVIFSKNGFFKFRKDRFFRNVQ